MFSTTIITFLGTMYIVAALTASYTLDMERSTRPDDEYFLGGRALKWPFIAGSLLLTQLSTEQLIGLNSAAFTDGHLAGVAWEVFAIFGMISTALLFLPRYLATGLMTIPALLESRFDRSIREAISGLFLFGYVSTVLPIILYTGSLAIKGLFELEAPLWWLILGMGALGSRYAIFGGLKSIAVSDTIYGVGLLIGGLAVPYLALLELGEGSLFSGLSTLTSDESRLLTSIASMDRNGQAASVPWGTLFTGMMFFQLFYWSMNQMIVQRSVGAKSLEEGQKGILLAALLKLIGPVMFCLPGLIALKMLGELSVSVDPIALKNAILVASDSSDQDLINAITLAQNILESGASRLSLETAELLRPLGLSYGDQVYASMVRRVLPDWSLGLFAAILFGSIVSTFNSALHSASTLFCLDFYQHRLKQVHRGYDQERAIHLVLMGQFFAALLAIISIALASQFAQLDSVFSYLQKMGGLYSVPILALFSVGLWSERGSVRTAKAAIIVGLLSCGVFSTGLVGDLHWLHAYALSLLLTLLTLIVDRRVKPEIEISEDVDGLKSLIDLKPWAYARYASWGLCALALFSLVIFASL